jgi:hypothetical protein
MDIRSEQKSQFRAYPCDVISRARPPMVKKPNNLFCTGQIELFPEYRSKFIPYSWECVNKSNKVPCYHTKRERKNARKVPDIEIHKVPLTHSDVVEKENMTDARKVQEAKALNNNYGVSSRNRYHEKLDCENNNNMYIPEYTSKYRPVIGERSAIIPQHSHFQKYSDEFNSISEYNNRYKSYDHFTKSAPIKKQDNLYLKGHTQMQPEYKERFKEIDFKSHGRQPACRQHDNLHPSGNFSLQMPEYNDKYRHYDMQTFPERSKGRQDFLCLTGDMDYNDEYRNNYVEFPRQRPILRKPSTNIQLSSNETRHERKPDNFSMPITMPYHDANSTKHYHDHDHNDEIPIEATPEYRSAMKNYLIKERSPSRGPPPESDKKTGGNVKNGGKTVDHNDVTKILTENKVNVPEEKIFNEHNEIIVEPLKAPSNFKIPTRSPTSLSLRRRPDYPIEKDAKFNEHLSIVRKPRKSDVSFDLDHNKNNVQRMASHDDSDDFCVEHNNQGRYHTHQNQHQHHVPEKKSPKFGRRAPNLKEDYAIRKKTNVIEGNAAYNREYPRRTNFHRQHSTSHNNNNNNGDYHHDQNKFYAVQTNSLPFAPKPSDSLVNNYQPNYEINKQQSYRESLNNNEPFVVLDREIANKVKQSSWMKKQWYDTN